MKKRTRLSLSVIKRVFLRPCCSPTDKSVNLRSFSVMNGHWKHRVRLFISTNSTKTSGNCTSWSPGHLSSPHPWCIHVHVFASRATAGCSCRCSSRLAVLVYVRTLPNIPCCHHGALQPAITKARYHWTLTPSGEPLNKWQLWKTRY